MNNELIELRNRFLLALAIALVFTIPLLFFFINKLSIKPSKILEGIKNEKTMIILVVADKCKNCSKLQNILQENNVNYNLLNLDRETKYEEILKKIALPKSDISPPTIIYLKDGILHSTLLNPTTDDLLFFIDYNEISSND